MNNDVRLIDANALKEDLKKWFPKFTLEGIEPKTLFNQILHDIDNAPTVELRLMKVEECAGHTIDYAMGWKACIEWIKKGGAE